MTTYIPYPKTDNRVPISACESKCKPKKWARFSVEKCQAYKEAMNERNIRTPEGTDQTKQVA